MKTRILGIIAAALVLGFVGMAKATIVDVSVATDKASYSLGEEVVVSVTAYNPNPEPVTLGFPTSLQVSYLMDGVFNLSDHMVFTPIPTGRIIQPYDSYSWNLSHDSHAMTIYPLDVGTHTVVGEVVGYGQSAPLQFEVIPEPSSISLLAIGIVGVRAKHRNKLRQHKQE